jgi:large subunit ribosomal protein L4
MQMGLVSSEEGIAAEKISVSDVVFGQAFNETLVHQAVTNYLAGARQGSHAQKNRAAVRGGGKKPWKQKGTGRARAGTNSSPIWRTGGVTFAAQPQDYSRKINKKMYRIAMRSILSELVRQERLLVIDSFTVPSLRTKELVVRLQKMNFTEGLIIVDTLDENLYLAARNIPRLAVQEVAMIDPVSLVKYAKILVTTPALRRFEERLA